MSNAPKSKLLGAEDGRQLAVDLLRELEIKCASDECYLENGSGQTQNNIAAHYLEALVRTRNAEAVRGFGAVLTDFIAEAFDGGTMDPGYYEKARPGEERGAA